MVPRQPRVLAFPPSPVLRQLDPGRGGAVVPGRDDDDRVMTELTSAIAEESGRFPLQLSKVARPSLRDETLPRDRLLDWLAAKIHHKAVFVIAEAGYGKTTLLADFSRRTRTRMLWYRLDEEDRDPVAVLNYLVASGRELEPGFAPTTAAMLRELGTGTISLDQVVATFIRELQALDGHATALVLDDYHLVEESPDVRSIVREILARGPERLTLVVLTRRRPVLPIARLRALGEVAELSTDDLRFQADETERLFRESYGQPLEADVLVELGRRTEGWAASLQLVRTAVRDRSPAEVRAFVNGLTGSQEELYDFLAEEVVGEMSPAAQQFLMRTAILQVVTTDLGALVADCDEAEAQHQIESAERSGLLGRRGEAGHRTHRYHPLVREFLLERLARDVGETGVRELHRKVARSADGRDWRLAAHHYAAAEDPADLHRVIAAALPEIMASGEFAHAEQLIDRWPPAAPIPEFDVFLSRLEFYRNRTDEALARGRSSIKRLSGTALASALANLSSLEYMAGDARRAVEHARALKDAEPPEPLRQIAAGIEMIVASATVGDLDDLIRFLEAVGASQIERGDRHYAGISALNLGVALVGQGRAEEALAAGTRAVELLEEGTPRPEASTARLVLVHAHGMLGDVERAATELTQALTVDHELTRAECLVEGAMFHARFADTSEAWALLRQAKAVVRKSEPLTLTWLLAATESGVLGGDGDAGQFLEQALSTVHRNPAAIAATGQLVHVRCVEALVAVASRAEQAADVVEHAQRQAASQSAHLWTTYCALLGAINRGGADLDVAIVQLGATAAVGHMLANLIVERLEDVGPEGLATIQGWATRLPERWRPSLRRRIASEADPPPLSAARLLDRIGTREDVPRLRQFAKSNALRGTDAQLGRVLARSLADPILVNDLGRCTIQIGHQHLAGSGLRRKVLALLLFLASRPGYSATRDQVLDALWPELQPDDAVNSLNQTVYFLRRVFEPSYSEETSPAYLHHDSDVLWLDTGLVTTTTTYCWGLIHRAKADPEAVDTLSERYSAPFALEFSYEEWAASFRDGLHAAYLETLEQAVREDVDAARFDRAARLARRAVEVDPTAESLYVTLIRICRLTGAHAAAAERYASYSSLLRTEYGIDAPPLESI
jgi:ATP/maltotriose-dependent transcriptional regulator MalT/DNA-binding SARP family transcriptional activator